LAEYVFICGEDVPGFAVLSLLKPLDDKLVYTALVLARHQMRLTEVETIRSNPAGRHV